MRRTMMTMTKTMTNDARQNLASSEKGSDRIVTRFAFS